MKFECKDLERALETPELLPDAREHARDCPACRHDLWLWSELSNLAPHLREQWDAPQLWPEIKERLQAQPRRIPNWRSRWRLLAAIAAVLLVSSGAVTWRMLQRQPPPAAESQDLLTDRALAEVERAEAAYTQSIAKLAEIAKAQARNLDSPLDAAYREKLQVLDSAIAELNASIAQNRYNARLQLELASLYKQKQQTLQEILHRDRQN